MPDLSRIRIERMLNARLVGFHNVILKLEKLLRRLLFGPVNKNSSTPSPRFVPIQQRQWHTDILLTKEFIESVQNAKWDSRTAPGEPSAPPLSWRGVVNMKDPFEWALYPNLLAELKPRTIFELGSYHGGSAVWMADVMECHGIDCHIHSYEINIDEVKGRHPKVTFHWADCTDLSTFDIELLKSAPHPWLVIEDAHMNLREILPFLDQFMQVGDYLVVEDTTIRTDKCKHLKHFLTSPGIDGRYMVDSHYTDMFGYNATWNNNSYLKKVR